MFFSWQLLRFSEKELHHSHLGNNFNIFLIFMLILVQSIMTSWKQQKDRSL